MAGLWQGFFFLGLHQLVSEDTVRVRIDQSAERLSRERTINDDTLIRSMIDYFPTFGPDTLAGNRFPQIILQTSPTPDVRAKKWLEL